MRSRYDIDIDIDIDCMSLMQFMVVLVDFFSSCTSKTFEETRDKNVSHGQVLCWVFFRLDHELQKI